MKILVALLGLMIASSAYAVNSIEIIAQQVTSGGMVAPGSANTYTFNLMSNGEYYEIQGNNAPRLILTLAPKTLESFKKYASQLVNVGPLQYTNPDQPMCADAPSTTYSAKGPNGKMVEVAAVVNCKEMTPSQYLDAAMVIKWTLQSLNGIANL